MTIDGIVVIRAWSGPRNLSTALLRAWENRPDTAVLDEPLYAHYLHTTGLDHPGREEIIDAGPVDLDEAIARCRQPDLGPQQVISYQKHMSHHLLPGMDLGWIADAANALVIRHPRRVIASYLRVRSVPSLEDLGLPQQVLLLERFGPLPVFDADRFLAEPGAQLRWWCDQIGVPFDAAMLSWPPGPRPSDGVWARHWYAAVERSSGFAGPPDDDPASIPLPDALEPLATDAAVIYRELLAQAH